MQKFGKITYYNTTGAYGFITPRGEDPRNKTTNKFFHASMIFLAQYQGSDLVNEVSLKYLADDTDDFEYPWSTKGIVGLEVIYEPLGDNSENKNVARLFFLTNYMATKEKIATHKRLRLLHRFGALPRSPKEYNPLIRTLCESSNPADIRKRYSGKLSINDAHTTNAYWIEEYVCGEWQVCQNDPRQFATEFLAIPDAVRPPVRSDEAVSA